MSVPVPVLVLLLPLLLLAGCAASAAIQRPAVGVAHTRPAVEALALLHRWDGRRSAAYAAGDPSRLRRLYSRGSWAGARDVRVLRAYADRGLVVDGLATQVLEVEVVERSDRVLRLRVVERFAGGTVRSSRSEATLPSGRIRERVLTLVRGERGWVLRSVRPA